MSDSSNGDTGCLWIIIVVFCLFVTCDRQDRMGKEVEDLEDRIEALEKENVRLKSERTIYEDPRIQEDDRKPDAR